MGEMFEGIGLAILTAVLAAVILVPIFIVVKVLMDLGLDVLLPSVVVLGLLLAYVLRRETVGG